VRVDEISAYVEALDGELPTLIVGDFNEDGDGRAIAFLHRRGMRSALPQFHPRANTWRWTTSVGTVHHQLDHVVYDNRLVPVDATVVPGGGSDHLAVLVTLQSVD
jgi:endonuclease/exonuclease/phosphatase (EEP) superfamily protein YafD